MVRVGRFVLGNNVGIWDACFANRMQDRPGDSCGLYSDPPNVGDDDLVAAGCAVRRAMLEHGGHLALPDYEDKLSRHVHVDDGLAGEYVRAADNNLRALS